jgi:hypothetical protein
MTPTDRIIKALRERVRQYESRTWMTPVWRGRLEECRANLSTAIAIRDEAKARKHG